MSRYTAESRDRVRDAVDMVALVSARTELRRAGVDSYFGLCPFHDERTGSFHVRPDEKHYHCFGCQASGDPFTFVMETEGLDFKAALEALAARFGVELQTEDEDPAAAARRQRRERLYTLLGRAATYYARYLWEANEAAPARQYLLARGLNEQTLREFRVGYAPSAWDRILTASRRAGFSDEELLEVGLVSRSRSRPGQVYDRFRERIMFPSADEKGRVRGFGARAMRDNQQPKYLNTADGILYHKREQLFGIDLARATAAKAGRMILVEGYTDVLALHQAGVRNVVAIMGTSLTEEQVGVLGRMVRVLELCLDADAPGQQAMLRASEIAAAHNPPLELRVVPLPAGVDPAELVERSGPEELRARVDGSVPFVVFHVDRILAGAEVRTAEGRDVALAKLRPLLAELPPSVLRDELMRRVAGRLELSDGQLASLLAAEPAPAGAQAGRDAPSGQGRGPGAAGAAGVQGRSGVEDPRGRSTALDPTIRAERTFLVYCIALPAPGAEALASIDPDEHITSQRLRRAARHLAGQTSMPLSGLAEDDQELARVMAELVSLAGRAGEVRPAQLEQQRLVLELARLDRAMRRARAGVEGAGDLRALALERQDVLRAIRGIDMLEKAV